MSYLLAIVSSALLFSVLWSIQFYESTFQLLYEKNAYCNYDFKCHNYEIKSQKYDESHITTLKFVIMIKKYNILSQKKNKEKMANIMS